MTPAEIEKEAERKLAALADDVTLQMVDPKSQGWQEAYGYVLDALRAVHDAAYEKFKKDFRWACQCDDVDCGLKRDMLSRGAHLLEQKGRTEGFNEGVEKAAKVNEECGTMLPPTVSGFCYDVAEQIRTLKIGDAQ